MTDDQKPAISIAIPAYNYGRYLPFAIQSVLQQDFTDVEIVVCDDCSTDDTAQRVAPFLADPRVRYLRNPSNLGAVRNINKAVAETRGSHVLLLGADDFLLPGGSLRRLLQALQTHPEAGFAYGAYVLADEDNRVSDVIQHGGHIPADLPPWRDDFPDLLVFHSYINLGATLFRREVIEKFGFFDPLLTIDEFPGRFFRSTDWELLLRLSLHGVRSAFVNSPLAAFRLHSTQSSVGGEFDREGIALREFLVLLKRYLTLDNAPRLAGREHAVFQLLQAIRRNFEEKADPARVGNLQAIMADCEAMADALRQLGSLACDEGLGPQAALSVVVSACDNPGDLLVTLQDLRGQQGREAQVLVINRGQSDLGHLCAPYRYLQVPGARAGAARSYGAHLTDGELLCFIEAGTRLGSGYLAAVGLALSAPGTVATQCLQSRPHSPEAPAWLAEIKAWLPASHPWKENLPSLGSFAFRRHILFRAGGFDLALPALDDLDFLLRLQRYFPIAPLAGPAAVHPPSFIKSTAQCLGAAGQPAEAIRLCLQAIANRGKP